MLAIAAVTLSTMHQSCMFLFGLGARLMLVLPKEETASH